MKCINSLLVLQLALALTMVSSAVVNEVTSADHFESLVASDDTSTVLLFCAAWRKEACRTARQGIEGAAASSVREDVLYAYLDASKFRDIAQRMSVEHLPTIMLFSRHLGGRKVIFNGHSLTAESINSFVEATLQRHSTYETSDKDVRDEKARNANNHPHPDPGKVVDLTNEATLEKYARDSAKTVLVAFIAPWCSHCNELKPVLERLAKYFEGTEKIVIATFNGDANRELMDHFRVSGFPTIRLFPKGTHLKNRGLLYRGERSYETMQYWIQAHNANVPLDGAKYPFREEDVEDR